jgi:hypothetical protein
MPDHHPPTLSPLEARVIGVLVEKQLATPDYYPLTLNALLAGCNQKTSRHPIMNASEDEIQVALDALKRQTLVIDSFGASGRVMRYAHNLGRVLALPQPAVPLLASLMLRGPQTAGELRLNCERMHAFPDISSVEAYLEEMAQRAAGALVVRLAKQPGSREHRYAHLLCGAPQQAAAEYGDELSEAGVSSAELGALKASVLDLRAELDQVKDLVARLYTELGVSKD